MKKPFLLIALLCLLAAPAARAADFTDSVLQNGGARQFLVHIPDRVLGHKNLPVVIALHGGGGNAAQFEKQTGMNAVADANGFIAVYPDGTAGHLGNRRTWNAGGCCGNARRDNIDDVGFISAVIDALAQKYAIDTKRVYVTGHSNGSMMAYRLACQLSGKIAAVAPVSGQRVFDDCHPKHPVAVLHIHGTADPCALYNGGAQCGGCFSKLFGIRLPGDTWACPPVKDSVREQARLNGCAMKTETVFTKGAVTCLRHEGCPAEAPVELCSIAGEGHRWPGATDTGPPVCRSHPARRICARYNDIVGPINDDIDGSAFIWNFFKHYHLP